MHVGIRLVVLAPVPAVAEVAVMVVLEVVRATNCLPIPVRNPGTIKLHLHNMDGRTVTTNAQQHLAVLVVPHQAKHRADSVVGVFILWQRNR